MQRLRITHLTEYQFAVPVQLGAHRLMLCPREGHDVHIEQSSLVIAPAHRLRWQRDTVDNIVAVATFDDIPAHALAITSEVLIQQFDVAPLDFLVDEYAVNHPFAYAAHEYAELLPFLQPLYPAEQGAVRDWLGGLGLLGRSFETFVLLDTLNRAIARHFEYRMREEPGVQSPAQTLARRSGSCRDYATLFIEACRGLGLASRFVSGYLHNPGADSGPSSTHAWAEVYLPGPGWKGFDQTGGVLVGADHIPVSVARHPETVPPVAGSYFGPADPPPLLAVDVHVVRV
ncbi:transglutaminase-like putative cysteine protease [Plasticicumulans lactativorans]|uniref:Transglutaminase-like putative cysteine protease n=1 Tax=Plasticicumulans lactativorans TaxID=1133106 RepID=A0A4R2KYC8_9GAMM|nr:transglutaminase family protein [Plasticicumulans lactativorans]TCO76399.1 transglutaminase-like putative cysteine protease [Plasticicumulans lactativorans]